MIEEKLQLLSILSPHVIDCEDLKVEDLKSSKKASYAEMFNLLANDCMNIIYPSSDDTEESGDALEDLKNACEDAGISFVEVNKEHGSTYLNIMFSSDKIDSDVHSKLIRLLSKVQSSGDMDG